VLLDAHSILSQVPRFIPGQLADFNFGTADGSSCSAVLVGKIKRLNFTPYSSVYNQRFKGGYITRAYGDPSNNIRAIQLELSQYTYMDEPTNHYNEQKAEQVKKQLKKIVQCLVNFAKEK